MQLKQKAVRSVQWASLSQVVRQLVQFGSLAVLATLLAPEDFGLLSMALVVTGMVDLFKDLGTRVAIIQKTDATPRFLSSIFWVNAGIGTTAALLLLVGAQLIALVYKEPRLIPVLQVLAINFPISGLGISIRAHLEKNISFGLIGIIEAGSVVLGAITAIIMALFDYGVWALVAQSLVTTICTTIFSWILSGWRPQFTFDWQEIRGVLSFSMNYTGFNVLNYIARNFDYFLIGRYLGKEALGYYTLAYRIMVYPVQNISFIVNRVMFPVLSKVQDDNDKISRAFLQISAGIALVSFPLMLGVMALSDSFVEIVLGEKWLPVAGLLVILAPVGMFQSINSTVGAIYLTKNRTDTLFQWGIFSTVITIAAFIIGLQYGITGMAWAYLATSMILFYPSFKIPLRFINLKVRNVLSVLWIPLLNGLLMLGVLVTIQQMIPEAFRHNLWVFTGLILLGISIYAGATLLFNRSAINELRALIKEGRRQPQHTDTPTPRNTDTPAPQNANIP